LHAQLKIRQYIYPESGFEDRYERVLIFEDMKNAYSFSFNRRDVLVRKNAVGTIENSKHNSGFQRPK
jgi:hypothetical protein